MPLYRRMGIVPLTGFPRHAGGLRVVDVAECRLDGDWCGGGTMA